MEVLFRAEVERVGRLSNHNFESLIEINKKWYAIGTESYSKLGTYWIQTKDGREFECKHITRAVYFEGMLDSEGNKIFASLSEDGKGGDIISLKESYRRTQTHIGDNIPMGSYTEPLELEIKTIESVVIMKDGIISTIEDSSEEYTYPLSNRLYQDKINDLEILLQNGYKVDTEDIEYIQEEYELKTEQDIVDYFKSKVIGIK